MNLTQTLSFIGAGNMATSIIGGLIRQGLSPRQIVASSPEAAALQKLAEERGIAVTGDNQEAAAEADILLLCVKPQVLKAVCEELRELVQQRRPLIISIAAGIESSAIENWLGGNLAVIRCMPNTPALVGLGASGLYANPRVTAEQKVAAEQIFAAVGIAGWVDAEADMHAVTALSGSGPAYFFLMLEAMEAAGVQAGLSAENARQLSIQTMLGAATMAQQSGEEPAVLKRRVMSPGGTTERAIQTFEDGQFRQLVDQAVAAAALRSRELAKILGES